jgi:hypothetical protein
MDVTAVLERQYVPPEPPKPGTPSVTVNPSLSVGVGVPALLHDGVLAKGFNPNSPIDVTATDAQGASASTQVNGTCPVP